MGSILIVDDEETIRDTLSELLSMEHSCQSAESAEQALALLATNTYDVVLTDISLPGLSGLELLGHVLQNYVGTPVIVISGISDKAHAQGLIRLGAFDYLLKPFRLEVVEESVRRAIATSKAPAQFDQTTSDEPETDSVAGDVSASDWSIVKDKPEA